MSATSRALMWFRNDLRLHDNPTLRMAQDLRSLVCVYCIDPRHYGTNTWHGKNSLETPKGFTPILKTGPFRSRFVIESVLDLQTKLRAAGSDLLILKGKPEEVIPKVVSRLEPSPVAVYATGGVTPEETWVEQRLDRALGRTKLELNKWNNTMHHPVDFSRVVNVRTLPQPFTAYRRKVEKSTRIRNVLTTPSKLPSPGDLQLPAELQRCVVPGDLESLEAAVGLSPGEPKADPRGVMKFTGGETAALARLESYCKNGLATYKKTRNGLVGATYSTKFSPWLSLGCLSPRQIYWRINKYEKLNGGQTDDTYWVVFELMWRDWFYFLCAKHGAKIFFQEGPAGVEKRWSGFGRDFDSWRNGTTGDEFVDANMRELMLTGWMSNRGRQNVASYLIHNLHIDWRLGAMHFEQYLLDHDPCSNYGNWCHAAGLVDRGQRINRFNTKGQAARYDPNGEFRNLWNKSTRTIDGWLKGSDEVGGFSTQKRGYATSRSNGGGSRGGGRKRQRGRRQQRRKSNPYL